jgi:hypothetical protein
MLLGTLLPSVTPAAAAVLADNVPLLDSLSGGNPRDDHTFTAATGTWSVAGTLLYEQSGNSGDMRSELRQGSPAGALLAYDPVGNFYTHTSLSVLAVDGWNLGAPASMYVSEILNNVAPAYAVEFEGSPTVIVSSPFSDTSSMGNSGVVQAYQVFLAKRDTIDIQLSVPASYTYNYNLQLYLFGGASTNYYSSSASVSPGPAAASGGPVNADQFIRFIAPVSAWYLLVVGNTKELANVPYTLTAYTNGRGLADTAPLGGTVTNFNVNDDFSFGNAANDWGFVAVRTNNPGYGEWLTAELHTPTFDSNVLAAEGPTTGAQRAGVLAINRYQAGTPNVSLVTVRWGPYAAYPVAYTIEMDNRVPTLPASATPRRFNFAAGEILRGGSIALNRGETLELHADVGAGFTYPYELGLIVFAPGFSYYAAQGQSQAGPIASAREGPSTGKDLTFTAPTTGFYGVAVLSLNSTYAVPVDLTVTVQGRPLLHNDVRTATLGDGNPQDLYAMTVDANRWGVVAGKLTAGTGVYTQKLMADGFDANPVASDTLGTIAGMATFGLEAVNGYVALSTDYFASVVRTSGTLAYTIEFDSAPLPLPRNARTNVSVPDGQLVSAYEVNLNAGETADFRLRAEAGFSYPYNLRLSLFSPAFPFYSLSGGGAPSAYASSLGTANSEQDAVIVAPWSGSWLVVIANLGDPTEVPSTLDVRINGEPLSPGLSAVSDLTGANGVDYFAFNAPAITWTVAGVKIGSATNTKDVLVHSLRGPTPDSISLATDRARGAGGEGVIAIDGFARPTDGTYYLRESALLDGANALTYQVQIQSSFLGLTPGSQVVTGSLSAASQFTGYQMGLTAGQTLDLRLRRAEGFSYPYNLGLYVFGPGAGNASSSGESGGSPLVASANGPSLEQDGIFTAITSGVHLILVVNLDVPRDVIFALNLTLDGWQLADSTHLEGDLNAYNRADQYSFEAAGGSWSAAGVKWTGGSGTVRGGLHTLGLNTLPLATVDANAESPVAVLPFFAPTNASSALTTFFLNVTMAPQPGAPTGEYSVGFAGQPAVWSHQEIGTSQTFTLAGSGFFALHELQLEQGDWVDIRVQVAANYTKQHDLNIALFDIPQAPQVLQVSPLAVSHLPSPQAQHITFFANESARYLLVVENAGNLDAIPYTLSVTTHSVQGSPPQAVRLTIMSYDKSSIELTWTQSTESDFAYYEVWVSDSLEKPGTVWDTIRTKELTYEKIDGPTIQPGKTYYLKVVTWDTESLGTASDQIGVTTNSKSIFEDSGFWILVGSVAAVGVVVFFAYWRARAVRDGKPFRFRSSKAEGVVRETKGPEGKPRAPKGAGDDLVPAAPSKQTQDAVDYMQRVMKGGR